MSAELPHDPSVPKSFETLGEHYRLVKKLGEGAFGVVYEAHHDLLDQDFAVKILKPELCDDENLRQRFLDEARALIRFSHPNVVQLRHVGEQEGRLYLVMDLVKGSPLNVLLRQEGALGEDRAVDIMLQVLAGLEAAHAAGIVHRDLKPSNLVVDEHSGGREHLRILDFGLSKLSAVDGLQAAHRSVTGAIIGTLAYMSPEQLSGESDIDARSDIFAAGLVLHEMIDGRHPYPDDSGIVVAAKLLREPVPDLDAKRSGRLKDSTRSALRQALERDRDARFSSAFGFAQALEGKGPPSDTSRVTTIQEAREALARTEAKDARTAHERRKKHRKTVAWVGLVILIAAALGVFLATRDGGSEDGGGAVIAKGPGVDTPPGPAPGPVVPPVEPTPAVVEPTPAVVEPTPAVVEPTPAVVEPTPAVVDPTPAVVDPTPAVVEPTPAVVEPTPAVVDPSPVVVEPTPAVVEPTTPDTTPVPPALLPEAARKKARELATEGKWTEARAAWQEVLNADPIDVEALRGAAMTWLRDADTLARHGEVEAALASLNGLIDYLTTMYRGVYEPRSGRDRQAMMHPLGFALTHRGEAHTERARWLRVQGNTKGEKAALTAADADLKLAWQFLERDGVNYWDLLLRRAELRRLQGDAKKCIQDLALTTKVDSNLVPPRMWVAHFTGLRREAERALFAPRAGRSPARAPLSRKQAEEIAREALQIAKKGVSWTRTRGEAFTREQWNEAARVVVVNDMARPESEDRTPLEGLLGWYLDQMRAQTAPAWEPPDLARAKILSLEAGRALMQAKILARRGEEPKAQERREEAIRWAQEAVQLREKVASEGGELPSPCPYAILAYVLQSTGKRAPAEQLMAKIRAAAEKNPE